MGRSPPSPSCRGLSRPYRRRSFSLARNRGEANERFMNNASSQTKAGQEHAIGSSHFAILFRIPVMAGLDPTMTMKR